MKLTNGELVIFSEALVELSAIKTDFKIAYAISKTLGKIDTLRNDFSKARKSILETHCLQENGKPVIKDNSYQFENDEIKAAATAEVEGLNNMEITLEAHTITRAQAETIKDITGNLVFRLRDYITE